MYVLFYRYSLLLSGQTKINDQNVLARSFDFTCVCDCEKKFNPFRFIISIPYSYQGKIHYTITE